MSDNLIGATKAVFTVSLSVAVGEMVAVEWSTRDGTAKAGADYEAVNGVVSFAPGETVKQIEVTVYGQEFLKQNNKNFFVALSPPINAVLNSSLLECIITIDGSVSVLSIVVPQGKRGFKGDPGLSAYEQAVFMGYQGTLEDWMDEIADASQAAERAKSEAGKAKSEADRALIEAQKAKASATSASFMGNIFPSPEAGVDPITGVLDGAYYNVRSPSDDNYIDEYQNLNGVPTPSGKSYPSSNYIKYGTVNTVESVAELAAIRNPRNNQSVFVKSHTSGKNLGSGTYIFEQLSSKTPNSGAWIASSTSAGVWVLISELHFENFGVVNDGTDQSGKIQNAINFILQNDIRLIEFERANEYAISKHVSFSQAPSGYIQLPSKKVIVKFNGVRLRLLTANQVGIEVARDYVRMENPSFISSVSGCVGIYNGLITENNDDTLRRSSQFMEVVSPCTEGLDTAIKFVPNATRNGGAWGAYYHSIIDHSFRSTKIGFHFDICPTADNATTRTRIFGGNHVGGSCTFLCNNAETLTVIGFASEFITTPDSRLPDGKACTIVMPFNPSNADMANGYSTFDGASEAVTRHYNVLGVEVDLNGRYINSSDDVLLAKVKTNSYLGTRGTEGSVLGVGRGDDPARSARLLLRRYKDSSVNGGSNFSISELTDGSGFTVDALSDHVNWKNRLNLNFDSVALRVIKPITPALNAVEFKNLDDSKKFTVDFRDTNPTLWGGDTWNLNGFNIEPLLDLTTNLGSVLKRFNRVSTRDLNVFPRASANPEINGQMVFELTSDTQLKIKVRGSDGVTRSTTLTLA